MMADHLKAISFCFKNYPLKIILLFFDRFKQFTLNIKDDIQVYLYPLKINPFDLEQLVEHEF